MDSADKKRFYNKWIPQWMSLPFVVIVAFLVFMLFFGNNSYIKSNEYRQRIADLNTEIKQNEDSAALYEKKAKELNTDRESLEKIAREQYGMKKANEDVYVTDIP